MTLDDRTVDAHRARPEQIALLTAADGGPVDHDASTGLPTDLLNLSTARLQILVAHHLAAVVATRIVPGERRGQPVVQPDVQIEHQEGKFLLRGETATHERRDSVARVVRENFPEVELENQIRVTQITEPVEAEEVNK